VTAGLEEKVHLFGFVGSGRFEGEGASVGLASIRTLGGGVNGRAVQVGVPSPVLPTCYRIDRSCGH
jgi:hypothetical protein